MAGLAVRAAGARRQLAEDLATLDPRRILPAAAVDAEGAATPLGRTQGGVAIHVYEELAQHYGQMQLTRDVLRAASGEVLGPAAASAVKRLA